MADEGDKNRKRRRIDKKDSNDDGVIDLTSQSKANSFKIHDVVDLTAPVAPKPVQSSQKSMGGFKPKTFGDCDIVSTKDDKLFDDDIVIVVSDAYREKKREERRNKAKAPIASTNSDPNLPSTSSGWNNVSTLSTTASVNQTTPLTATQPANNPTTTASTPSHSTASTPSLSTASRPSTPSLSTARTPSLSTASRPSTPSHSTARTPPLTTSSRPPAPISTPSTASNSIPQTTSSSSSLASLTVSSVITAVTGALASLATPASSPSTGTTTASNGGTTTASNGGATTAGSSNGGVDNVNRVDTENELWIRFRRHDQRKEYMCPCSRCRCRNWWLTFDTVKRHCDTAGCVRGWVRASSPTAATSEFGVQAIAAGGQVNSPGLRPPPRPVVPPPARPAPPPAAVRAAAPPPNTGPVITDNRPSRTNWRPGYPIPGLNQNIPHNPAPRRRLVNGPAGPPGPIGAPSSSPSLDNLPLTVPNVVDSDPNPLTCPVCLDSKAQIQASSRTLVSTTCGHVFCSYCIEQVFKSTKLCPQCRKKLSNRGWHPLYI